MNIIKMDNNKCIVKFLFEKDIKKNIVLFKDDLFSYPKYDSLITKIIDKSKNSKTEKLSPTDKFILKIENYEIEELKSVWNSVTYSYLY